MSAQCAACCAILLGAKKHASVNIPCHMRCATQGLSSLPKHDSMTTSANLIGGSAIGSLPKGLTMEQKKTILQATPMSPSLSLLNSMGPVRSHSLTAACCLTCTGWCQAAAFVAAAAWCSMLARATCSHSHVGMHASSTCPAL